MTHYQYVPARTSHILHFLLSCLTLGLWVPVWFFVWLHNHNRMVTKALPMAQHRAMDPRPYMADTYQGQAWDLNPSRPSPPQGPALPRGEVSPYGQQHQMPPRLPSAEAQGVQHQEGGYH